MSSIKPIHIVIATVLAVVFLCSSVFVYVPNKAVGLEETISESASGIQIQEKRQHDLILQLAQVVTAATQFESNVQIQVAELRTAAAGGDVANAMTAINAVAEAYPDLKSNAAFTQLMTEMAISENLKKEFRETYIADIKDYRTFVRRFPNRDILNITGYEVINYDYLQFDNTELPADLFEQ